MTALSAGLPGICTGCAGSRTRRDRPGSVSGTVAPLKVMYCPGSAAVLDHRAPVISRSDEDGIAGLGDVCGVLDGEPGQRLGAGVGVAGLGMAGLT